MSPQFPASATQVDPSQSDAAATLVYRAQDMYPLLHCCSCSGSRRLSVNLSYFDTLLAVLQAHAAVPQHPCASSEPRQMALADYLYLERVLDHLLQLAPTDAVQLRLRAAQLALLGSGLRLPRRDQRARVHLETLLAAVPDHPQANLHYGELLATRVGQPQAAVVPLQRAFGKGLDAAARLLGEVFAVLGRPRKARHYLQQYLDGRPDDAAARALLAGLAVG